MLDVTNPWIKCKDKPRHLLTFFLFLFLVFAYIFAEFQPYKCNKRLVISLNPLPHCGPLSNNGVCDVCKRRLAEPDTYSYCSISCKVIITSYCSFTLSDGSTFQKSISFQVTAFGRKSSESDPPFLSIQSPTNTRRNRDSKTELRKRKRKGIPCRAPFFWRLGWALFAKYISFFRVSNSEIYFHRPCFS